jgi:protein involved in polysaccharide export with SLBB domain
MTRRVSVLGAVKNPGLYQADPTFTVADVISLAGGVTEEGRRDRVEVMRNGVEVVTRLSPDVPLAVSPVQSGDQIYVQQKSFLSRNPYIIPGVITTVLGAVLAAVLVR